MLHNKKRTALKMTPLLINPNLDTEMIKVLITSLNNKIMVSEVLKLFTINLALPVKLEVQGK